MSSFTQTQLAAIFGTAIATITPATQFSVTKPPVALLTGGARIIGTFFPTTYFHPDYGRHLHQGARLHRSHPEFLALAAFIPAFTLLSLLFLKKQET